MSGKVLIITYYWPPSGGAGVQRWVKFAKYLPEYGWEPVILTVDPEYAAYPVKDESLLSEIPSSLEVNKTAVTDYFSIFSSDKSKIPSAGFAGNPDNSLKGKASRFIRGNFFIPDPRKGWNKYALKEAAELIRKQGIKHVITTSPPHSTQLIGLKIKKMFPGINWVADLRDPWTDIYYYDLFYPTFISRAVDRNYEKQVLHHADRIITVGENLAKAFVNKLPDIGGKASVVTNGYDEADFEGINHSDPSRFTITYAGTLSEAYPVQGFINALAGVAAKNRDFVFRIVGTVAPSIRDMIIRKIGNSGSEFIPYSPHHEAIRLMTTSSMLLLVIPETRQANVITTGKVFEYIASRRPVIYTGPPDGDAASLLRKCGHDAFFSGKDPVEIEKYILRQIDSGTKLMDLCPEYSRKNLTGKLARILDSFEKK